MAVVSPVPGLSPPIRRIQRHDFGSAGLISCGGEIEVETPRVVEEKIYVAVGKDVKQSKSNLLWALRNSEGKKICLLHVHLPPQMIPMMGGKFPADKLAEEEVRAYRNRKKQKMHRILTEYLLICAQSRVLAEKVDIEMVDNIEKGIIELVNKHGIKRLVMGAAADKHYSKNMTELKSKKAIFVSEQAPISCHISFVCRGCLIYTRDGSSDATDIGATPPSPLARPMSSTGQSDQLRSRTVSEGMNNHVRLTNPVQNFLRRVRSAGFYTRGGIVTALSAPEGTSGMLMPQNQLGTEGSSDEREGTSKRSPSRGSGVSKCSLSEDVVVTSDSMSLARDGGSDDLLPSVHESENSKRETSEESIRYRKVKKDAIEAIRKAEEEPHLFSTTPPLKKQSRRKLLFQ